LLIVLSSLYFWGLTPRIRSGYYLTPFSHYDELFLTGNHADSLDYRKTDIIKFMRFRKLFEMLTLFFDRDNKVFPVLFKGRKLVMQ